MSLRVDELVSALPLESDESAFAESADRALRELIGQLATKPVPVSRLARLWALGSVQAKVFAAYLAYWIRSSYAARDERERRLNETHLAAAIKVLGMMGYLRGAMMKAGQMMAAYPNILPRDAADVLGRLHFEAPPMHYSLIREYLRGELGGDPRDVFDEFETQAFAAASLGQVHRARLKSGESVAIKVQYPGIARTIAADFKNLTALAAPMRLTKDWDNIRQQWEDIRQTLEYETDYVREASFLDRARAEFSAQDEIVVPRTFPEYSTRRVLTMEYLDGVHIDRYLKTDPSQPQRDRFGELIMRGSFRIAHKARFWYADSNPGNFLFLRDGRLGLIDFGCCREFTDEEWDYYIQVCKVYAGDGSGLREAVIRAGALDTSKPLNADHVRFLEEYSHWWSDYLLTDGPFDFGDETFISRGVEYLGEIAKKRYFTSLPVNVWITRQLLGLRALAYRLRARINMKKLYHEESWGLY